MLSEISQTQKDKYCMIPLLGGIRVIKFMDTKSKMVTARGWGEQAIGSYYLMGAEFQFEKMKKSWKWPYSNVDILNTTDPYT